MKTSVFVAVVATLASAVLAHTEHGFPLRNRHVRRAGHKHLHKKHIDLPAVKRSGQCAFPTNCGLVSVSPGSSNAGWAMSPDQPCLPGSYCPYACPSGQVSMQWDPKATSYTYPLNMHGGLYCNSDGTMSKPLPNNPYCKDGVGTFVAVNEAAESVAICQTVLPGNEAMLIPTEVGAGSKAVLAVPDTTYWASTAAHFYINPPGVSTTEGCVWGSSSKPIGNWAGFVCGANQVANGNTFVTAGINPIYCCEPANGFSQRDPGYAIEIKCPNGGCTGLPCKCDPSTMGVNRCTGGTVGAGGAQFCVVTVASGYQAEIHVYSTGANASSNVVVSAPVSSPKSYDSYDSYDSPSSSSWSSSSSEIPPPSSTYTPSSSAPLSSSKPPHNATLSIAYSYHPKPSKVSSTTEIEISPSNVHAAHRQGVNANNVTTSEVPISSSPVLVATSSSDRLTLPLTTLLALAVVALGMVNM